MQKYENVKDDVDNLLTNFKIVEKRNLLISELALAKADNTIQSFLKAYDFISEDSFIEVKRYSSLLPREVLDEVFKIAPGDSVTINTNSGDIYIVDLINVNKPSLASIEMIYDDYIEIAEKRASTNISLIVNKDIFESAKINFNNLVF